MYLQLHKAKRVYLLLHTITKTITMRHISFIESNGRVRKKLMINM